MTNITEYSTSALQKLQPSVRKTEEKTDHEDKKSPRCNFPAGMLFSVAKRLQAPVHF